MNLTDARVLLMGAAGGIGSAVAKELYVAGARLLLSDESQTRLNELSAQFEKTTGSVVGVAADIKDSASRAALIERARDAGINVLINAAEANPFGMLENQSAEEISLTINVNALAPILMCRQIIPLFKEAGAAHIVNLGSSFGSLGFPGFAAYSASKFAIRGFTEALRRELADTGIRVHYVAPRVTKTRLITDRIKSMNAELKVGMDSPEIVAGAVAEVLRRERAEVHLGFPERCYAKLNGLLPGLVDRALARRLPIIRRHAAEPQV